MLMPTDDPLLKLEERGGSVWAFRKGHGAVLKLSYSRGRQGVSIGGLISDHDVGGDRDELVSQGWRPTASGLERTWVLDSDLNRSALRRDVDRAIAVLAEGRGQMPASFPLVHRAPGQDDGGYGQVGCIFAIISALVGEVIGIVATLLLQPGRASVLGAVVAFVVAAFILPWATGDFVPAAAGRIGRLRANAENVGYAWMLVAPALVAAATIWLIAALGL
jgi:hypothetical protein